MNIIEITPGDDNHLTMMMAKYHLNHVTGKDREHLLAYAKDVWNAAIAEEREAGGWRPFETAPKDGTAFRAYDQSLVHADFNPCGSVESVFDGERFVGAVWDGCYDVWVKAPINFTKWMPLPAAPKDEVSE